MKNLLVATVAALGLTAPLAFGDTMWISTSSQLWSTSGNWDNGVPGASSGAIFTEQFTPGIQHTIEMSVSPSTTVGIDFGFNAGGQGFLIHSGFTPVSMSLRGGGSFNGILNADDNTQEMDMPITMYSFTGFAGSAAAQTWLAQGADLVFGAYNGGGTAVNNNGGYLTIDGAFNVTIGAGNGLTGARGRGDIIGFGGLIKNGSGTLFLGGTNASTYSGATILNNGTIVLGKGNALGGSGALYLNDGVLRPTNSFGQAFGVLNMTNTSGSSVIDFGQGGTNAWTFADSHSVSWAPGFTLDILNFLSGTNSIRFGTSASGLTPAQLAQIQFPDVPNSTAYLDANGFLLVPEPSAAALGLLGGFGLALGFIYRRRNH